MINPYPGLPEFEYVKPASLKEASDFLHQHKNSACPFLGGTDVFVRLRDRLSRENYLVDIKRLEGLNNISYDPERGLTIGAAVNMNKVIVSPEINSHYPILVEACRSVASYQLRNRATIAGNICNASPAGDTIGACLLLDAKLSINGVNGKRVVSLQEFFIAPGETILGPGDIVTSIHFPVPRPGTQGKYVKLGRNKLSDLAIVGVTVIGYPNNDLRSGYQIKIALASVAPVPLVVNQVEELLSTSAIDENIISDAAEIAMKVSSPIDDIRASARYRKIMVRNLSQTTLQSVWTELTEHSDNLEQSIKTSRRN